MNDKQTEGWVKVIRGTKSRASADCLQRVVRPRSKKQAMKMVSDIVKLLPTVREWPNDQAHPQPVAAVVERNQRKQNE